MGKLKLMTIIGTRPEIIRLSATIKCCDRYFEQILVHTGQNYDYTLNQVFFDDLGLRAPDYYLNAVGDDLGRMPARGDEPPHRGHHQRRQSLLFGACTPVSDGVWTAKGAHLRDRQSHGRGAARQSGQDRRQ